MNRRNFVKNSGLAIAGMGLSDSILNELGKFSEYDVRLPALFIGHGSPMNAIENNSFTAAWASMGKNLPKPKAILCISAHWETTGTRVCTVPHPKTIHDFYGFPKSLFDINYPAPGAPEFASMTIDAVKKTHIEADSEWGLDHGSWSVLCRMFPLANVPVFQLSLDKTKPPQWHYELAAELKGLRKKGVLIIGSGNLVHNLRMMRNSSESYDWAGEFDLKIKNYILDGNHSAVINYSKMGTIANLAVPTNEHYLPLIYALALQEKNESVSFFNEQTVLSSVSMRSLLIK